MLAPVKKIIEVSCSQEQAFDVFVTQVDRWWPKARNSVSAMAGEVARSVTIEACIDGRVIELGHDGIEHLWGTVTRYEPPHRLSMDWHINMPSEKASKVDVVFTSLQKNRTRVELTHSDWEVFGEKASDMRAGYESGWVGVFEESFHAACEHLDTSA